MGATSKQARYGTVQWLYRSVVVAMKKVDWNLYTGTYTTTDQKSLRHQDE